MRHCRLAVASPAHIGRLANNLREIDRIECAAFGRSPKEALRFSLRTSLYALTAIDEATGQPLAMMGVSPVDMMQGKGTPWFLGSDDVFNFARDLIVTGPCMIDWWLRIFRQLDNVVALDNHRAIRLLGRWGATFDDECVMIGGILFIPFKFERASPSPTKADHANAHHTPSRHTIPRRTLACQGTPPRATNKPCLS